MSAEEWADFMQYVAAFFGNLGNYLSFGDTKFIPRCSKDIFSKILGSSINAADLLDKWQAISDAVYDLSPSTRQMGLEGDGIS